jgi:DNA-directed RNA polymerase specialized sigma24 family protein
MNSPRWDEKQFGAFLRRLHPTPSEAGESYVRLRGKLIKMFEGRGFPLRADELTDETIDRAIQKFVREPELSPPDLPSYLLGIARNICREQRRVMQTVALVVDPPDPRSIEEDDEESERRLRCLQHCLTHLSPEACHLVVGYHQFDGGEKIAWRQETAVRLNKTQNALRKHVFDIRRTLQNCIERCMRAGGGRNSFRVNAKLSLGPGS